jgi:hypothetical protein
MTTTTTTNHDHDHDAAAATAAEAGSAAHQENIQLNFGQLWQLCKVIKLPKLLKLPNFGK